MTELQLQPGATFADRYVVVRCIKAGGMGAVYEVVHSGNSRRFALKVMLPDLVKDPELRARFSREATVTSEIESDHIVHTTDAGIDASTGMPFLVMELLKGEDVDAILTKRGGLPPSEVITLLQHAALALDKTHAAGIVHRDLKPENFFVTRTDEGSPRLKVLDFGIAKVIAQSSKAHATRAMGTPLYMSPEQLQGDGTIGPRSDTYALGHIAFTMLVGTAYWEDESRSEEGIYPLIVKIMQGAKEPATARAARCRVTLPAAFDWWFGKATALDVSARYETALELVGDLADVLNVPRPRRSMTSAVTVPSAAPTLVAGNAAPAEGNALAAKGNTLAAVSDRAARARSSATLSIAGVAALVAIAATIVALTLLRGSGSAPAADASVAAAAASAAPAAASRAPVATAQEPHDPATTTVDVVPSPPAEARSQDPHPSAAPRPTSGAERQRPDQTSPPLPIRPRKKTIDD